MLQLIDGADLTIGDGGIAAYLRACLDLDQKPKAFEPFLEGAPPTSNTLADSPAGFLGVCGYGSKRWTWDLDWRDVAEMRIKGGHCIKRDDVQHPSFFTHAGLYAACLWWICCTRSRIQGAQGHLSIGLTAAASMGTELRPATALRLEALSHEQ